MACTLKPAQLVIYACGDCIRQSVWQMLQSPNTFGSLVHLKQKACKR